MIRYVASLSGRGKQPETYLSARVADTLSSDFKKRLDGLLTASDNRLTPFQSLKQPPGKASPKPCSVWRQSWS